MITIRRSEERGHADHGWLDARHTFSFASYHDPDFMAFRSLRVLNQDRVQPAQGFGTHGHSDMEIVTYVLSGAVQHRDSMGNGSVIRPGEVQYMSAGSGVTHSEFNPLDDEVTELLQMWVLPARRGTTPRYEQRDFSKALRGRMALVASGDGREGSIGIGQDALLYIGRLAPGDSAALALAPSRGAWLHVGLGRVRVNGQELGPGDGAAIQSEPEIRIEASEESEVVLWDLA
jgi:redox-sensitive bicupin YhaK (pirin superfamily)